MPPPPPSPTRFPYTTLFRSLDLRLADLPFNRLEIDGLPAGHAARADGVGKDLQHFQSCCGGGRFRREGQHLEGARLRSEEHTSELQSPVQLVCRLLPEKKVSRHVPSFGRPAARLCWVADADLVRLPGRALGPAEQLTDRDDRTYVRGSKR